MRPYGFDSTRYDSEDRLTIWNRTDGNQNQSWSLSLVGDWTNFAENGLGENRTHGPAHELQSVQNVPIAYDPKGNSHQKDGMTYSWDFGNRLYAAHDYTSAPLVFMSQLYDALGRRVCRICRGENPAGMIFVPLGQQTIADYAWNEMDVSKPTHRYIYGSYIDEPVVRLGSNDEQVYYHQNQQYSIVGLTGKSGEVLERYAYTAYGKPTILAANGLTELDNSAYANRYLYTGREWDSTIALYHYRARMYDPADGRFISRDPIGYEDGLSLYAYVGNRPLSAMDPEGLYTMEEAENRYCARECSGIWPWGGPGSPPPAGQRRCIRRCKRNKKQEIFDYWVGLEATRGPWWRSLPKCPLKLCVCRRMFRGRELLSFKNPDPTKRFNSPGWIGYHEERFHTGAAVSMRSHSVNGSSNQCTYDRSGRLITTVPGHGTVDWVRPGPLGGPHVPHDVHPVIAAAKLDGCWERDWYSPFGHLKPACSGPNMRRYFSVRPLWAETQVTENYKCCCSAKWTQVEN